MKEMDSLGRKKPSLPCGWIVETSKTYPDRIYYFNVITGVASWKCPQLLSDADSSECVEPPRNMENNKIMQEADTSTPTECSGSLQQEKTDRIVYNQCKRKISFNGSTIISPTSDDSKVNIASSTLKTETASVCSKSVKTKKKLRRPTLDKNSESTDISGKFKTRIILKAKRHLEPSKLEEHSSKRESVHLSNYSVIKSPSILSNNSHVESSATSPPVKKKLVNHVVNNKIINLKDNKSRFRRILDQKSSSLENELSGVVSSSCNSETCDQDVEMPDLSELLTNDDSPEPMQIEEIPFNNGLFIVVDTNVFLYSLKYIESLMETSYEGWGYPNIRIPWAVIQELDALKNNKKGKSSSIVHKAAHAVRFLYKMLQCKHPRIRGQTAADARKVSGDLSAECNDDRILQYCIQLAESVGKKNVILLTEDKNLCNKAFINDVEVHVTKTLQKDLKVYHERHDKKPKEQETVLVEKHDSEKKEEREGDQKHRTVSMLFCQDSEKKEEREGDHKHRTQLEGLINEAKVITKDLLSFVVESEMKQAFDEMWEMIIIPKPPWTLLGVLECLLRHWVAVFGFLFQRDMKRASEELLSLLKHGSCHPEDEHEVTKLFDLTSTICTCIYITYGSTSADKSLNQLEEIKKKWQTLYKSENKQETEDGESIVFSSFNFVWTVINHICGIIQDSLNYQCSIIYEKPPILPSREEIIQLIPKVHEKLEQLYQEMNVIITSTVIDINYKKAIFDFLITFRTFAENFDIQLPSFPTLKQITPEMLEKYYTNANNKEKLTNGHCQLKHFLSIIERIAKDFCLRIRSLN